MLLNITYPGKNPTEYPERWGDLDYCFECDHSPCVCHLLTEGGYASQHGDGTDDTDDED